MPVKSGTNKQKVYQGQEQYIYQGEVVGDKEDLKQPWDRTEWKDPNG